jgi:hypothetical protein
MHVLLSIVERIERDDLLVDVAEVCELKCRRIAWPSENLGSHSIPQCFLSLSVLCGSPTSLLIRLSIMDDG